MDKNMFYRLLGKEDTGLLERNKELIKENDQLKKSLAVQFGVNRKFAEDTIKLEEKLELLKSDVEQYIEIETERRLMQLEEQYKDQMNHKWYSLGRTDAYAEMGIRALESRKAGTTMYYIKDTGEVIEDITKDLEDLTIYTNETTDADEIEIEDLA